MVSMDSLGPVFEATTDDVRVGVRTRFIEEQSDPENGLFVWAYYINIFNNRPAPVQLLKRYWHITDAYGQVQEVRGDGVVGEQPIIGPGKYYKYVSGTPLKASSGFMRGNYEMQDADGSAFTVVIPAFSLDDPNQRIRIN